MWEQMNALNADYGFYEPIQERPEHYTTAKYMKKYNVSYSIAKQRLKTMLDDGHLVLDGIGVNRQHFYLKK